MLYIERTFWRKPVSRHMHFHREIDQLKKMILQLGVLVEDRLRRACTILETKNEAEAQAIMNSDWEIDDTEIRVEEECLKILGHCHSEMAAGGKLLIVEMVIPERNIPSVSKFLDLGILLFLGGTERTEAEYRALLDSTGFNLTRIVSTPSAASVIEAVRK